MMINVTKDTKAKTPYISHHSFSKRYYCYREYFNKELQQYMKNPDRLFTNPLIKYFKNVPKETSTVALVQIGAFKFVVKRYNVKNFWHRLKLWIRPSRAMTSWKNTHLLQQLDIPTLKPVAIIENRFGFFRNEAYFIYEYIDGVMCCDYFEKQQKLTPLFKKALLSMADSLKKMRQHRLYHRDCHHNNMIIADEKVLLLDLDHMKQYRVFKYFSAKAHQKDVAKFIAYLGNNTAAKDFFIKAMQN